MVSNCCMAGVNRLSTESPRTTRKRTERPRPSSQRITSEFVMNVVKNTGGFYETMAIANVLPDKMTMLAEHIDANFKAMSNWYEVEFSSDGRPQSPPIQVDTTREGVSVQMSRRRPF